jgi:hypothetical protein
MNVGDLVWVDHSPSSFKGAAIIVSVECLAFYRVMLDGKKILMHGDFMRILNEGR